MFLIKLTMADFPSDKYTFDCKYVSFCIELNTFIRLGIANSFLFLIFPFCYFYVMSQSTFPDQIRPRPLIACLNCSAKHCAQVKICSLHMSEKFSSGTINHEQTNDVLQDEALIRILSKGNDTKYYFVATFIFIKLLSTL